MVVKCIVYLPRGRLSPPYLRTCDLWGRLLQGEKQSTAVVGWAGWRIVVAGTAKQRSLVPLGGWCVGTDR